MINEVEWSYVALTGATAAGFRSKRARTAFPPTVLDGGIESPGKTAWASQPLPPSIAYGGTKYVPAFWSIRTIDRQSPYGSTASIQTNRVTNYLAASGDVKISARAFYVPDLI